MSDHAIGKIFSDAMALYWEQRKRKRDESESVAAAGASLASIRVTPNVQVVTAVPTVQGFVAPVLLVAEVPTVQACAVPLQEDRAVQTEPETAPVAMDVDVVAPVVKDVVAPVVKDVVAAEVENVVRGMVDTVIMQHVSDGHSVIVAQTCSMSDTEPEEDA